MTNLATEKASILHEALPYIRRFRGKTFVLKYGGHAMRDAELRESFARDVVMLKYVGIHPVVVHGGGPQIDALLNDLGVVSERVDGLRVTSDETMRVVEMVLGGAINAEIVSLVAKHGGRSIGLTGHDDAFMRATKVAPFESRAGDMVDLGRVGEISSVNPEIVRRLSDAGFLPIIAPIAIDEEGRSLNVNADTAAGAIAKALEAEKLVLMTDVEGVRGASDTIESALTESEVEGLKEKGIIAGGMIPKVDCALDALRGGVKQAHILDGRMRHATLLELFTDEGVGTLLRTDK